MVSVPADQIGIAGEFLHHFVFHRQHFHHRTLLAHFHFATEQEVERQVAALLRNAVGEQRDQAGEVIAWRHHGDLQGAVALAHLADVGACQPIGFANLDDGLLLRQVRGFAAAFQLGVPGHAGFAGFRVHCEGLGQLERADNHLNLGVVMHDRGVVVIVLMSAWEKLVIQDVQVQL